MELEDEFGRNWNMSDSLDSEYSNTTQDFEDSDRQFGFDIHFAIRSLAVLAGIVGNCIILSKVKSNATAFNTWPNALLWIMSANHAVYLFFVTCWLTFDILETWIFGYLLCKIVTFGTHVNPLTTTLMLITLVFDRIGVHFCGSIKNRAGISILIMSCSLAALLTIPIWIHSEVWNVHNGERALCAFDFDVQHLFAFGFAGSLFVMTGLWLAFLGVKIFGTRKDESTSVSVTVTLLVLCHLICQSPLVLSMTLWHTSVIPIAEPMVLRLLGTLADLDSAIYPFVILFLSPNYQRENWRNIDYRETPLDEFDRQ